MVPDNSQEDLFGEVPAEVAPARTGRARGGKAPEPPAPRHRFFVEVAINRPLHRTFTYGVPDALIDAMRIGVLVHVRFAGQRTIGMVIGVDIEPGTGFRIQPVLGVASPGYHLTPDLVALARWIAEQWLAPIGETLQCMAFFGFHDLARKTVEQVALTPLGRDVAEGREKFPRMGAQMKALLAALHDVPGQIAASDEVLESVGAGRATLLLLVRKGLVQLSSIPVHRVHEGLRDDVAADAAPTLTDEQAAVVERVQRALDEREPLRMLLHGVTGSGKTEVYMKSVERALELGGSALILVPEISLTPQAVSRFRARFGDRVGVYHSKMTPGQKLDLYHQVSGGQCRVMVGARSAIFAPVNDLRLIVLDEEHEASYKQDAAPRYHARSVALERARRSGAVLMLGSATPSLESYMAARRGDIALMTLTQRVDGRSLPPVQVVDLTVEAREGRTNELLSVPLRTAMQAALDQGKQSLLFINRRGFHNFAVCLACQVPVRCQHCDAAMTHHRPKDHLVCHWCGRHAPMPKACEECGSTEIALVGMGTQRVESQLKNDFPTARIVRIDADTMKRRTAHLEVWRDVEKGEFDILVGTQMVARGIHVEGITVVGVPLADGMLFQPDFRAAERAFCLLTQVAGRAGRGKDSGTVYVQTHVPHHYAVRFAREHDYIGFFEKEARIRQVLRFPPWFRLAAVLGEGVMEGSVKRTMQEFSRVLRDRAYKVPKEKTFTVLGPAPAPLGRVNDQYRWRLLVRATSMETVRAALREAQQAHEESDDRAAVQITVDIDPQDLL